MKNVMSRKNKLACSICEKGFATLGCYNDGGGWWLCNKCFSKADALAARDDRWPDARDYIRLRETLRGTHAAKHRENRTTGLHSANGAR